MQARQQAEQAHYKTLLDAYREAYDALYVAETRRNELLAQQHNLLEQGAVDHKTYSYAQAGTTDTLSKLNPKMSEQDKALAKVNLELTALTCKYNTAVDTLADAESALDAAAVSTGDLTNAKKSLTATVSEVTKAYGTAKTAARESIDSQIGLFDKLADKSEMSAAEIVKNWGNQQKAFFNYSDNLRKAVDMGLDKTLVTQLSDGSQKSMQILNSLVNDTEVSVDEINAAFGGLGKAKDNLAGTMAKMEFIANGTYDDMVKAAKAAGYNTVDGLAKGVRNNTSILESAMRNMGKKAQAAYNRTMEIKSPSRVMERAGGDTVAGAVRGVEKNTRDLEAAMREMAKSANTAYLQEQLDYTAQYPSMVAMAPVSGSGSTTHNNSVAYGGISINIHTQPGQDARDIADAVLQELAIRLGQEEVAF